MGGLLGGWGGQRVCLKLLGGGGGGGGLRPPPLPTPMAQSTKGNRGIDMLFLDIQLIDENIYSI